MKMRLKVLMLRLFNWFFSKKVTLEGLSSIKILVNEGIRFSADDVDSIKILVNEGIRFSADGLCLKNGKSVSISLLEQISLSGRLDDIFDIAEGTQLCFSQEGESLILDRFFDFCDDGFYVDVGAHHPKRFSNTYSFYKRGWRGVNIDPTPGIKEMFDEIRPEDVTLSVAVSDVEGKHDFYLFKEPALNTFSQSLAEEYKRDGCELVEVRSVDTRKLSSLLDECQIDRPIDFMSIDVEDYELSVLQSNDWIKFRPKVLLVEILDFDLDHPDEFSVHSFILDQDYVLFAKTYNTLFYRDKT